MNRDWSAPGAGDASRWTPDMDASETDASAGAGPEAPPRRVRLRLLHLSDVHAHLHPWDYDEDRPAPQLGLAAAAATVEALRAEAPNSLLFDGGDVLQGAPLADRAAAPSEEGENPLHPVIAAMNAAGVDAAAFGNHDFNYGLGHALAAARQADFPVVLANLVDVHDGRPLLPPWALLERVVRDENGIEAPLRIGALGLCPPQVMQWDANHLEGRAKALDIAATAAALAPRMRAAGCDLVVALCHSGIAAGDQAPGAENAALALARVPGVDVVLTGHQHRLLPGPDFAGIAGVDAEAGRLHGLPAVMPGCRGEHVGVVDLELALEAGRWRVARARCRLERTRPLATDVAEAGQEQAALQEAMAPTGAGIVGRKAEAPPRSPATVAAAVLAASRPAHLAALEEARRPAGRLSAPVHSWFAMIADSPGVHLLNLAQRRRAAQLLAGTPWQNLPLLSAAAPFRAGWRGGPEAWLDIPAGPVDRRALRMVLPFPNALRVAVVDGAALRLWLERSAGAWADLSGGVPGAMLLAPEAAPYNFDLIDGIGWTADLSRPPMFAADGAPLGGPGRITALEFEGAPVRDGDLFAVATNSYRIGGGGRFPGMPGLDEAPVPTEAAADALLGLMQAEGEVDPTPPARWRLTGLPAGGAILRTAAAAPAGPEAAAMAGGLRIEDEGTDSEGFGLRRVFC